MKIRIAIAEDNNFLVRSLIEKLEFFEEFEIVLVATNGKELIDKLQEKRYVDIVLMDIQMPVMDGIEATRIVRQQFPQIRVIMLTVLDDDESVFQSILNGANGYLLKEVDPASLHRGILEIMDDGAFMSPSIAAKALDFLRNPNFKNRKSDTDTVAYKLSDRETEVLIQMAKGLDYKQIGKNLFISSATVRKHIENIYRKLEVHNKMQAVEKARKSRLI